MKLEPCRDCGRMILQDGPTRCDPSPLDGQGVATEVMSGRKIWTPTFGPGLIPQSLRPASPGDTKLLREHDCAPVSRPATPPEAPAPPKALPGPAEPRVALSTPSSARQTERSSASSAGTRTSEPVCDGCGQPCTQGTYASIEVGSLIVWAEHVSGCGGGA